MEAGDADWGAEEGDHEQRASDERHAGLIEVQAEAAAAAATMRRRQTVSPTVARMAQGASVLRWSTAPTGTGGGKGPEPPSASAELVNPNGRSPQQLAAAAFYIEARWRTAMLTLQEEIKRGLLDDGSTDDELRQYDFDTTDAHDDYFEKVLVQGGGQGVGARAMLISDYLDGKTIEEVGIASPKFAEALVAMGEGAPEGDQETDEDADRRLMLRDVALYYYAPGGHPNALGYKTEEEVVDEYEWELFSEAMDWYYGSEGPAAGAESWVNIPIEMDRYRAQRDAGAGPSSSSSALVDAPSKFGLVGYFWRTGELPEVLREAPAVLAAGGGGAAVVVAASNDGEDERKAPAGQYIARLIDQNRARSDALTAVSNALLQPITTCRAPFFHERWKKTPGAQHVYTGINRWRGDAWYVDTTIMQRDTFADMGTFKQQLELFKKYKERRSYRMEEVMVKDRDGHARSQNRKVYDAHPDHDPVIKPLIYEQPDPEKRAATDTGRAVTPPKMKTLETMARDFRLEVERARLVFPEKYARGETFKAIRVCDLMRFVSGAETSAELCTLVAHWRGKNVAPGQASKREAALVAQGTVTHKISESTSYTSEQKAIARLANISLQELDWRREGKFTRGMWPEDEQGWVNYVDPQVHRGMEKKSDKGGPAPLSIAIDDLANNANLMFQVFDDARLNMGGKNVNQQELHKRAVAFRNECVALRKACDIELREVGDIDDPSEPYDVSLPKGSTGLPADGGNQWVTTKPPTDVPIEQQPFDEQPVRVGGLTREPNAKSIQGAWIDWLAAAIAFYRLFAPWPESVPEAIDYDADELRGSTDFYEEGQIAFALRRLEEMKGGKTLNEFEPPLGTDKTPPPPPTFERPSLWGDPTQPPLFRAPLGWPGSDGWDPAAPHTPIWSNYATRVDVDKGYPHLLPPIPLHDAPDSRGNAPKHDGLTEQQRVARYYELHAERERLVGTRERAVWLKRYDVSKGNAGGRVASFSAGYSARSMTPDQIIAREEAWFDDESPWFPATKPSDGTPNALPSAWREAERLQHVSEEIGAMEILIRRERVVRIVWAAMSNPTIMDAHMHRLEQRIDDLIKQKRRREGADFREEDARRRALSSGRKSYGNDMIIRKAESQATMVLDVLRLKAQAQGKSTAMAGAQGWERQAADAQRKVDALEPLEANATIPMRRARLTERARARAWSKMVEGKAKESRALFAEALAKLRKAKALRMAPPPVEAPPAPRYKVHRQARGEGRGAREQRDALIAQGQQGAQAPDPPRRDTYLEYILAYAEATSPNASVAQVNRTYVTEFTLARLAERANRFAVPGTDRILSPERRHWLQLYAHRITRMLSGFDVFAKRDGENQTDADRRREEEEKQWPGFSTAREYGANRELPAAVQQFSLSFLSLLPSRAIADGAFTPARRTHDEAAVDRERWRAAIADAASRDLDLLREPRRQASDASSNKEQVERMLATRNARALFYDRTVADARTVPPTQPALYELDLYKLYVTSQETREALKWMFELVDYWEPRLLAQLETERGIAREATPNQGRHARLQSLTVSQDVPRGVLKYGPAQIAALRRNVDEVLLSVRLTVHERVNKFWGTIRALWERGLLTYTAFEAEWGRVEQALPTMHWMAWCFFDEFKRDLWEVTRWRKQIYEGFDGRMSVLRQEHEWRRGVLPLFKSQAVEDESDPEPNWEAWPALYAEYKQHAEAAPRSDGDGDVGDERQARGRPALDAPAPPGRRQRPQQGGLTPWGTDAAAVQSALSYMIHNPSLQPPIRAIDDAVFPNYPAFREAALSEDPDAAGMGVGRAAWERHEASDDRSPHPRDSANADQQRGSDGRRIRVGGGRRRPHPRSGEGGARSAGAVRGGAAVVPPRPVPPASGRGRRALRCHLGPAAGVQPDGPVWSARGDQRGARAVRGAVPLVHRVRGGLPRAGALPLARSDERRVGALRFGPRRGGRARLPHGGARRGGRRGLAGFGRRRAGRQRAAVRGAGVGGAQLRARPARARPAQPDATARAADAAAALGRHTGGASGSTASGRCGAASAPPTRSRSRSSPTGRRPRRRTTRTTCSRRCSRARPRCSPRSRTTRPGWRCSTPPSCPILPSGAQRATRCATRASSSRARARWACSARGSTSNARSSAWSRCRLRRGASGRRRGRRRRTACSRTGGTRSTSCPRGCAGASRPRARARRRSGTRTPTTTTTLRTGSASGTSCRGRMSTCRRAPTAGCASAPTCASAWPC